jgi:branched-subunit amino acid permease
MVQVGSGGGFPPFSTGVIVFVLGVCAAAEIGLAIPVVKAKVSAMVKISFFMIEFLLVGATFAQKRKFLKKN